MAIADLAENIQGVACNIFIYVIYKSTQISGHVSPGNFFFEAHPKPRTEDHLHPKEAIFSSVIDHDALALITMHWH